MSYKEIENISKMTDNIIFLLLFIIAICSQVSFRYSMRTLGIKVLKDKTFGRHVKSKRFKSKENTFFLKFFRKKHATKKSGNLNTISAWSTVW